MPQLILISGSGIGAGKTTLAKSLGSVVSLADGIRRELQKEYPTIRWFDKSQENKTRIVPGTDGKTVRDLLIDRGQSRKTEDNLYWCKELQQFLRYCMGTQAVDDVRMLQEVEFFKKHNKDVVHLHIDFDGAISEEGLFENEELKKIADYIIHRGNPFFLGRTLHPA